MLDLVLVTVSIILAKLIGINVCLGTHLSVGIELKFHPRKDLKRPLNKFALTRSFDAVIQVSLLTIPPPTPHQTSCGEGAGCLYDNVVLNMSVRL
jgi:hypothetical protein